jgi:tryptophanyl-tRNA synthetase
MSLRDPSAKMSKSDVSPDGFISMLDPPETVARKLRRATMDSLTPLAYDVAARPGVSNLMSLVAACAGRTVEDVARECAPLSHSGLKDLTTRVVNETLAPIQARYSELMAQPDTVAAGLARGAEQARALARANMADVRQLLGLA